MKFIIKVDDQKLVDSQLLNAIITLKEITENSITNNMFFSKFKQEIKSEHVVIDTDSADYKNSASRKDSTNVFEQRCDYHSTGDNKIFWKSKKNFVFDCSVSFYYPVKETSPTIRQLLSSRRVLDSSTIDSLLEGDNFADFKFKVRGKEFKVHKCLMAAASSVFKTMFTSGLDESKDNSATIDCNPEVFEHFLVYIYKNILPMDKMPSICSELYELAHCYCIKSLANICSDFINEKKIDKSNALSLYEYASTSENEEMLELTWNFIKT